MTTTTDHLRQLLAKATSGPWDCSGTLHLGYDLHNTKGSDITYEAALSGNNAKAIVALINAAPALLDVVEAAIYSRKILDEYAMVDRAIRTLDEALAKLDADDQQ